MPLAVQKLPEVSGVAFSQLPVAEFVGLPRPMRLYQLPLLWRLIEVNLSQRDDVEEHVVRLRLITNH